MRTVMLALVLVGCGTSSDPIPPVLPSEPPPCSKPIDLPNTDTDTVVAAIMSERTYDIPKTLITQKLCDQLAIVDVEAKHLTNCYCLANGNTDKLPVETLIKDPYLIALRTSFTDNELTTLIGYSVRVDHELMGLNYKKLPDYAWIKLATTRPDYFISMLSNQASQVKYIDIAINVGGSIGGLQPELMTQERVLRAVKARESNCTRVPAGMRVGEIAKVCK